MQVVYVSYDKETGTAVNRLGVRVNVTTGEVTAVEKRAYKARTGRDYDTGRVSA